MSDGHLHCIAVYFNSRPTNPAPDHTWVNLDLEPSSSKEPFVGYRVVYFSKNNNSANAITHRIFYDRARGLRE